MTLSSIPGRAAYLPWLTGLLLPLGLTAPDLAAWLRNQATLTPASSTPSPTTSTAIPSPTATATPAASFEASSTATASPSPTPGPTHTQSIPPSPTPTASPTPAPSATLAPSGRLRINEVAWAGTLASASDEWIELHNPGVEAVDLSGWVLSDGGDIHVRLSGVLPASGFFLLERTDDTSVANIRADLIYTGSLANAGESLSLFDSAGRLVDSANAAGGAWPAGDAALRASMERLGSEDAASNWATYQGLGSGAIDAAGNPILGTPRGTNSQFLHTPTPSPQATRSPTPVPPRSVWINEVAWAGTLASASDEWIELHNPGPNPVDLSGWVLSDGGDVHIELTGVIPASGYFLFERTDDATVADIGADLIYTGGLNNGGEVLSLMDAAGRLIDSANQGGGAWPAGSAASRASMERRGGEDQAPNWASFTGWHGSGHDASGAAIQGTPRSKNSIFFPTPTPTWIPGRVVINEVLIRPHHDWQGAGGVDSGDEFIELYNHGPHPVYLRGWILDDVSGGGSRPFALPGVTIDPKAYVVFFRTMTHIALNDSGDSVRLMAPDGRQIDKISYLRVRAYNLSYGRLPDGSSRLAYGLWPTPGRANLLFVEPSPTPRPPAPLTCADGGLPWPRLPHLARLPAVVRWMWALGHGLCR